MSSPKELLRAARALIDEALHILATEEERDHTGKATSTREPVERAIVPIDLDVARARRALARRP